jgi:hypothetical protein
MMTMRGTRDELVSYAVPPYCYTRIKSLERERERCGERMGKTGSFGRKRRRM